MKAILAHDASLDAQAVRAALAPEAISLESTTSLAIVAGMIQQESIDAVLVCARDMDDPRIDLVRTWRSEGVYDGCLILLCPGKVAEDAYRLCREGIFDDYVFIEPMHDSFRLRLALARAQAMRVHEQSRSELAALSHAVVGVRGATTKALGQMNDDWREMLPRLRRLLELLEERESDRVSSGDRDAPGAGLLAALEGMQQRQRSALASLDRHVGIVDESLGRVRTPDTQLLLLVDDDPAFTELFEIIVSSLKYRLRCTREPRAALRLIKDLRPVVVFVDVEMPEMSGIELLRAIRADRASAETPVILITGKRDLDTVLAAKRLNVNGYLVKPPPASEVAAKLEAVLGRQ